MHVSCPNFAAVLFFFNDTATTEIYTLSLHDALPISNPASRRRALPSPRRVQHQRRSDRRGGRCPAGLPLPSLRRSEEHTSELQSQSNLVCRPLLDKEKDTDAHSSTHFTLLAKTVIPV